MSPQTKTTLAGTGIFLLQLGAMAGLVKLISLTLELASGRTIADPVAWLIGYLLLLEMLALILVTVAGEAVEGNDRPRAG